MFPFDGGKIELVIAKPNKKNIKYHEQDSSHYKKQCHRFWTSKIIETIVVHITFI